jgi:hypothetical protein
MSCDTVQVHHYYMECFDGAELPEFCGMDDMCHWARFAASGNRPELCPQTKDFSQRVKKVGELSTLEHIIPSLMAGC